MTPSHRRVFLGYVAALGVSPVFSSALVAQIAPGTKTIDVATIREAARLAGLDWSDAECQDVAEQLSSLAASVTRIGKDHDVPGRERGQVDVADRERRAARAASGPP